MTVWAPTSPCDPTCLAVPAPVAPLLRAARAVRLVARLLAVAVVLAAGVLVSLAGPLIPATALVRAQRGWALALVAATGVRVRRSGPPVPTGTGTLVVANHVSWLDALALHAVAPVRLLAKQEVGDWPLIGAMATRVGTVFLERERLRALPHTVATLAAALRAGTPVGLFPEGTTRCGRDLGDFRPAAFQAAVDAGAPVQPVALVYRRRGAGETDSTAAFVGDDTLWSSLRRVLGTGGLVVEVHVLTPIDPVTPMDPAAPVRPGRCGPRRDLAARCAAAVATALPAPDGRHRAPAGVPVAAPAVAAAHARRELDRAA